MPRIDIELTSARPDGTWTWRAAGARQPKGVVDAAVLHDGAKVGDVVKAEADFDLDGINVTSVVAPKTRKAGPELIPLLGSGQEEELVTHSPLRPEREGDDRGRRGDRGDRSDRFGGGRGAGGPGGPGRMGGPGGPGATRPRATPGRGSGPHDGPRRDARPDGAGSAGSRERPRGDRPAADRPGGDRPRGDRPGGDRPRGDRPGGDRPGGDRPGGDRPGGDRPGGDRQRGDRAHDRPARDRPARLAGPPSAGGPARPTRPPAKRLQPGRAHREAALAGLAPEQRAIAEQVLRGGLAGVRQAVEEQNSQTRAAGGPEIRPEALLSLAEELLPSLRAAEWRDRAEATAAIVDEVGLRDLRSIVAGADLAGRDEESRALATLLREGLERRSAAERQAWTDEIASCLAEGRVVRALRVSGRAPEQGLRLPAELSAGLSTAVAEAMTPETAPDRWLALLEAVLASPVRRTIAPKGLPAGADQETLKTVRAAISKVPALGPLLGESPSSRPVPPPPPRRPPAPPAPPAATAPVAPETAAEPAPAAESMAPAVEQAPAVEPRSETPAPETAAPETAAEDAPVAGDAPESMAVAPEMQPVAAAPEAPAADDARGAADPVPEAAAALADAGEDEPERTVD